MQLSNVHRCEHPDLASSCECIRRTSYSHEKSIDCSISCTPGAIWNYFSFSFPSLTCPSDTRCAKFCTAATSRPVSVSHVPDVSDRANYFDLTCVPRSNRHVYASGNTLSSKVWRSKCTFIPARNFRPLCYKRGLLMPSARNTETSISDYI